MSKPVFDDVFRFHGRRNRRSYALFTLAIWSLFLTATFVLVLVGASASENLGTAVAVLWLVGLLPFAWASWSVSAQRCRDIGWTGWAALLALMPYVGFAFSVALFFIPGTSGANRYGPDPVQPVGPALGRLRVHAA
ncbi:MAG: DUF805 domain-containing protein [Amaricoccus sp.]|uniref:DUF805 domain-containing protein n=1 Tax=Amaricoccus sp. TaxID=1872485 RepID=UPI0039E30EAC